MDLISGAALAAKGIEVTKSLLDLKTTAEVKEKTAEIKEIIHRLLDQLIQTQARLGIVQQENETLKANLSAVKKETEQRERYVPVQPGGRFGPHLYQLQTTITDPKTPQHYACPNCFHKNLISILQPGQPSDTGTTYYCFEHGCRAQFFDLTHKDPSQSIEAQMARRDYHELHDWHSFAISLQNRKYS